MTTSTDTTFGLEPGDLRRVVGLGALHFLLLGAYFMLKPARDEVAAYLGGEYIDVLWTRVFFVNLAIAPIYAYFVKSRTRVQVLVGVLAFFALSAVAFAVVMALVPAGSVTQASVEALPGGAPTHDPRRTVDATFYVWASVLPLLVVSSFWSFVSDICSMARARRIFGFVAAIGTAGSIVGSIVLQALSRSGVPVRWTLVAFTAVYIAAIAVVVASERRLRDASGLAPTTEKVGGTVISGFVAVARSPLLIAICAFILLMTLSSGVFYYVQSDVVRVLFDDRDARREFLSSLNEHQGYFTLVGQLGLTTLIMRRVGIGATLVGLPLFAIVCATVVWYFGSDWFVYDALEQRANRRWSAGPGLDAAIAEYGRETLLAVIGTVLVAMYVARYAFAKPAREALFTLVSRDERFKSKNFIDTAVYRGGDVLTAQLFGLMMATGFASVTSLGAVVLPAFVGWVVLALVMGRAAKRRSEGGAGS
ncbi:MAG: Npt1/Npt2 family nucleotide transporter [Planctomycetota bacterium]